MLLGHKLSQSAAGSTKAGLKMTLHQGEPMDSFVLARQFGRPGCIPTIRPSQPRLPFCLIYLIYIHLGYILNFDSILTVVRLRQTGTMTSRELLPNSVDWSCQKIIP